MATWSYSDYVTLDIGPARLTRLRLHIQEVSDRISSGSYAIPGFSTSKGELVTYLGRLEDKELQLASLPQTSTTSRSRFTRGHPLR